jgi:hypothetical protein
MPASFVREVVAGADLGTSQTTLVLTIPGGVTVAVGRTLYVGSMVQAGATRTLTVTDSKGNTWTTDVANGGSSQTSLAKSHITVALVAADTITLTWSGAVNTRVATVCEFSNLDTASGVDKTATGAGNTATPTTAATTTTAQADELLIGVVGISHGAEVPSDNPFTAGTDYTAVGRGATTGASSNHRAVSLEYRGVLATGTYTASGSILVSRTCNSLIGTYKASAVVATPRSQAIVIG